MATARRRRRQAPPLRFTETGALMSPEEASFCADIETLQRFLDQRPGTTPIVLRRLGELGEEARFDLARLRRERTVRLRRLPATARRKRAAARVAAMFALALGGAAFSTAPAYAQTAAQPVVQRAAQVETLVLKVMDTGSGKPLAGVRVKTVSDELLGVTDQKGQLQLAREHAQEPVLSLEREGYPLVLLEGAKLTGKSLVGMRKFADAGTGSPALKLGGASARQSVSSSQIDDPAERLFKLALEHSKPRDSYSEAQAKAEPAGAKPLQAVKPQPSPTPAPTVAAAPLPTPAPVKPIATPRPPFDPLAGMPSPEPSRKPALAQPVRPVAVAAIPQPVAPVPAAANPLALPVLPTPAPPVLVQATPSPAPAPVAAVSLPVAAAPPAGAVPPAGATLNPVKPAPVLVVEAPQVSAPTPPEATLPKPAVETPTLRPQKRVAKANGGESKASRSGRVLLSQADLDEAEASLLPQKSPPRSQKHVAKVASADSKAARALRIVLRDDPAAQLVAKADDVPVPAKADTPIEGPDAVALLGQDPVAPPKEVPVADEPKVAAVEPAPKVIQGEPPVAPEPPAPEPVAAPALPTAPAVKPVVVAGFPDPKPNATPVEKPAVKLSPRSLGVAGPAQPYLPFPLPRAFQGAAAPSEATSGAAAHGADAPVTPRAAVTVKLPHSPKLAAVPAPKTYQVSALPDDGQHGDHAHDGAPMDDVGEAVDVLPVRPRRAAPPVPDHQVYPKRSGGGHAQHGGASAGRRGAPPPAYAVSNRKAVRHVVQPGDTLSAIAQRELGSAALWPALYRANRDQLVNPNWLRVGTVLKIPRTSAAMAAAGARVHVVQPGDTLWAIAKQHLGNPTHWPKVYAVNRHIIRNPWLIYPGQRVILPVRVASGVSDAWGDLSATHEPVPGGLPRVAASE